MSIATAKILRINMWNKAESIVWDKFIEENYETFFYIYHLEDRLHQNTVSSMDSIFDCILLSKTENTER